VRPSFNYIEGALDAIRADALFLGIAGLGKADTATKNTFYAETVEKVKPGLVVPIHWDDFFLPLDKPLQAPVRLKDNLPAGLDYMIARTERDQISFKILQAFQSILLFSDH
jgi:L-ascorbate metabolism protein UlaG (beta-lactamase superfamily)